MLVLINQFRTTKIKIVLHFIATAQSFECSKNEHNHKTIYNYLLKSCTDFSKRIAAPFGVEPSFKFNELEMHI